MLGCGRQSWLLVVFISKLTSYWFMSLLVSVMISILSKQTNFGRRTQKTNSQFVPFYLCIFCLVVCLIFLNNFYNNPTLQLCITCSSKHFPYFFSFVGWHNEPSSKMSWNFELFVVYFKINLNSNQNFSTHSPVPPMQLKLVLQNQNISSESLSRKKC